MSLRKKDWSAIRTKIESQESRWPTLAVIALDSLLLVFSWRLFRQDPWYLAGGSIPLLALVLLHAYLLLHEATHSAISRNRRINSIVGHVCGWMIAMPFLSRQRSHLLHHSWTGHPEGDPANKRIIRRFAVITNEQADRLERIWSSWLPMLTFNDRIGMWRDPFVQMRAGTRTSRLKAEGMASCVYLGAYGIAFVILALSGHLSAFLCWYLPASLLQLVLEELANLPHHAETPLLEATDPALPLWEQDRVTHSCKSFPLWSSCVLLNFNLHTAHHMYPWVSWSGLPGVHQELLPLLPKLRAEQETRNELDWSLRNRKRPLLKIMGHYFDKIPRSIP